MLLGIDNLILSQFENLRNTKVGLCANISSCDRRLRPTVKIFEEQKSLKLSAVFAPEHGLFGALQDQEKSRDFHDPLKKIVIHSLYGKRLFPTFKTLSGLDIVVIDLQDIGTRYYTFVWTAILLIKQMAKLGKPVLVLDRPNPLNGNVIEGPVLEKRFSHWLVFIQYQYAMA